MAIVYRIQKGAPLSAQDLDSNFRELETRIDTIDQANKQIPQWKFSIIGSVLTVKDAQDQIVAESIIPVLRFIPKGIWKSNTAYVFNDIVCQGSQVWCALKSHKSQENLSDDSALWMLFADLTPQDDKQ